MSRQPEPLVARSRRGLRESAQQRTPTQPTSWPSKRSRQPNNPRVVAAAKQTLVEAKNTVKAAKQGKLPEAARNFLQTNKAAIQTVKAAANTKNPVKAATKPNNAEFYKAIFINPYDPNGPPLTYQQMRDLRGG